MASEVVTDAVKHGEPEPDGGIGLLLEEDQYVLRVVVTDGGEGFAFDPSSIEDSNREEHFGLLTDREQVAPIGGGSPWTARRPSGWRLTLPPRYDAGRCSTREPRGIQP